MYHREVYYPCYCNFSINL